MNVWVAILWIVGMLAIVTAGWFQLLQKGEVTAACIYFTVGLVMYAVACLAEITYREACRDNQNNERPHNGENEETRP